MPYVCNVNTVVNNTTKNGKKEKRKKRKRPDAIKQQPVITLFCIILYFSAGHMPALCIHTYYKRYTLISCNAPSKHIFYHRARATLIVPAASYFQIQIYTTFRCYYLIRNALSEMKTIEPPATRHTILL